MRRRRPAVATGTAVLAAYHALGWERFRQNLRNDVPLARPYAPATTEALAALDPATRTWVVAFEAGDITTKGSAVEIITARWGPIDHDDPTDDIALRVLGP